MTISVITEALRHFPGIGPMRLAQLHESGVRSWTDLLACSDSFQGRSGQKLREECHRCFEALERRDVAYFCNRFESADKWRILAQFFDDTTFFDIETDGLDLDSKVTVIGCWHRGELRTFVEHENLDDFLDLLDDVKLLASFNGSAFDVPKILNAFHIPALPCPHVDLRWMCYQRGWKGTLKKITRVLDVRRPHDLADVDGSVAIQLWFRWRQQGDTAARDLLLRYCSADVLLLILLGSRLAERSDWQARDVWSCLPNSLVSVESPKCGDAFSTTTAAAVAEPFGRLAAARRRMLLRTRR